MLSNPIKHMLTILTISICSILFLYFSSFTTTSSSEKMIRRAISDDIEILGLPQDKLSFVNDLEGIDQKGLIITAIGRIPTDQVIIGNTYTDDLKRLEEYKSNGEDAHIKVESLNELKLARYYKYAKTDYTIDELKTMKNWCFVLDRDHGVYYKVGDKLTVDGIDLTIVGKFSRLGSMWNDYIAPIIVVSEQYMYDHYKIFDDIDVSLKTSEKEYMKVKAAIKENVLNAMMIRYIDEIREHRRSSIYKMSILIYFLIGIVGLINFMMIFNSIYTSVVSKRKEIGMLRAIGMTSKQYRRSLYYQGNILIILMTAIGLPIGYAIPFYGHLNFMKVPGNEDIPFIFPIWSLSIFIVFYILMRSIIKFCIHRIEKETVTELIRYEQ